VRSYVHSVGEYGRCQGIYRCWNISYMRAEDPTDPTAEGSSRQHSYRNKDM
jgi:hypothetical protein